MLSSQTIFMTMEAFLFFTNQNKFVQLLGLNTQNDVERELCFYHPKNT